MSIEIKASCQCGQLKATCSVPETELPIQLYLCSCDICRWISGQIAVSIVDINRPLKIQGQVTRYAPTNRPDGFDRCFCHVCGSMVWEDCLNLNRYGLFAGAMDDAEGLLDFTLTIYAGSTKDGGITRWLPDYPAWVAENEGEDAKKFEAPSAPTVTEQSSTHESLPCSCFCGGVQFDISRPSPESYSISARYSDSIVPFHSSEDKQLNTEDNKWWIKANGSKWAANVCGCTSCRKSSGQDLVQWAFIPTINIQSKNGSVFDFESGTLRAYTSSEQVKRYFCRVCGASVFWTSDGRPGLIDVAVGLLRSKQGSLAEDWLEWLTERLSFMEEAQNKDFVRAVETGMKKQANPRTKSENK